MLLRERLCASRDIDRFPDDRDADSTGGACALDDGVAVLVEGRVYQMGV
jgi:hypothetical protein